MVKIGDMKATVKIKWDEATRTLSGDKGVEALIAKTRLPNGYHWLIANGVKAKRFLGSRKIQLRPSGKGQVTIDGVSGMACEMVTGKNSSGEPLTFVMAREPVPVTLIDHLGIHTPVGLDFIEEDIKPYRGAIGRDPTPEKWAVYFRWAKSEKECSPEVLAAAGAWHWMVMEKRRGSPMKIHVERLREHLERVKSLGVVVNPSGMGDSHRKTEGKPVSEPILNAKMNPGKNPRTPEILAGHYEDARNGILYPLPYVIRESSIAADLIPYCEPLEEYTGWVKRFGWKDTPAAHSLAYAFNRTLIEEHKVAPFETFAPFVSFPTEEPDCPLFE